MTWTHTCTQSWDIRSEGGTQFDFYNGIEVCSQEKRVSECLSDWWVNVLFIAQSYKFSQIDICPNNYLDPAVINMVHIWCMGTVSLLCGYSCNSSSFVVWCHSWGRGEGPQGGRDFIEKFLELWGNLTPITNESLHNICSGKSTHSNFPCWRQLFFGYYRCNNWRWCFNPVLKLYQ